MVVTIEDDFIAVQLSGQLREMPHQFGADPLTPVVAVNRNVLDVADATAAVDELVFENQAGSADDLSVELGHYRADPCCFTFPPNFDCFGNGQIDRGQAAESLKEAGRK